MTIGAWVLLGFISLGIGLIGFVIVYANNFDTGGTVATILVCFVLVAISFGALHWWCNNTAAGQRAFKTQESNLGGGLNRTVTVYSYDGTEIKSWTGQFDVTENDQETWFDFDGKRVIIQGGIIINEED